MVMMTTRQKQAELERFANRQLDAVILPFWTGRMIDEKHGGFVGKIDHCGKIIEGHPKSIVLNARILWTFSAVFKRSRDKRFLDLANRAYAAVEENFHDPVHGGYVWSIHPEGSIHNGKKQVYAQAFVIYALVEFAEAAGHAGAVDNAIRLYRLIEEKSFDPERNGYLEAFTRDWGELEDLRLSHLDLNEKKTANTHLHILEAYTRLYQLRPHRELKERLLNLLHLFRNPILQGDHHMGLFFDENWNLKSDDISYGHDIEAAWLLYDAARSAGDPQETARQKGISVGMAEAVLPAMNPEGGLIHEGNRDIPVINGELEWWAQAEAIIGFLYCFGITGEEVWLDRAVAAGRYIEKYFIDRENGEWYFRVDKAGRPIPSYEKAGPWKCPYHTARMCLEIQKRVTGDR